MSKYFDINRLYRDTRHSKVSGVCAGLAEHWGQPRWVIRVAALALLITLTMPTAVAYIMAVILIPSR
ncbi:MAG: phage shock protein C [Paraglaciecola sp.]|jgi:phage shock protein C